MTDDQRQRILRALRLPFLPRVFLDEMKAYLTRRGVEFSAESTDQEIVERALEVFDPEGK